MENGLDPRELARIKKEARNTRIRLIRRRITIFGASLAAVFSGAVLVRSQLDQPGQPTTATGTAPVSRTVPDGDLFAQVTSLIPSGDGHGEESEGDESGDGEHGSEGLGQVFQVATDTVGAVLGGQPGTSSSSTSPAPAPLTTSQS
jgi:hypothetical protein